MGWETLAGVIVGAALALISALAIEAWRDNRNAKRAARVIQTELINISLAAKGFDDSAPFPYPAEDAAWRAHRDRLVGAGLSDDDWITLSSFYVTNYLVEKGAMRPPTCAEVDAEITDPIRILGRLQQRRWWHRFRWSGKHS